MVVSVLSTRVSRSATTEVISQSHWAKISSWNPVTKAYVGKTVDLFTATIETDTPPSFINYYVFNDSSSPGNLVVTYFEDPSGGVSGKTVVSPGQTAFIEGAGPYQSTHINVKASGYFEHVGTYNWGFMAEISWSSFRYVKVGIGGRTYLFIPPKISEKTKLVLIFAGAAAVGAGVTYLVLRRK